jgi:predicted DNA-binding transcriptional regulator AlpA
MSQLTNSKSLTPEELAPIIGRKASSIRVDVSKRPETLPPRLRIPGSRAIRFLEADVLAWLEGLREAPRRKRGY